MHQLVNPGWCCPKCESKDRVFRSGVAAEIPADFHLRKIG
jgi:hypothetical protein